GGEVALRGGAEAGPQGDQAGHAGQPDEQRDPAVPVARPAEQADRPRGYTGGAGARRAGACCVRHGFSCEPKELVICRSQCSRDRAPGSSYGGRLLAGRVVGGSTPPGVLRGSAAKPTGTPGRGCRPAPRAAPGPGRRAWSSPG